MCFAFSSNYFPPQRLRNSRSIRSRRVDRSSCVFLYFKLTSLDKLKPLSRYRAFSNNCTLSFRCYTGFVNEVKCYAADEL